MTTDAQATHIQQINDYIEAELARWQVPGLALAVIKDGEVIHKQGYGLRDREANLAVDADTVFAIGSCTKAFVTMGVQMLAEQGKLNWDTPIREYLPDFRLQDSVATQQMTARDLLCHRGGLPRHDQSWYGSPLSRRELYARLRYLQPSQPFRYLYQYQNLMYMTGGLLIEAVSGQTWEAFTQEHIFKPLSMTRSQLSVQQSEADDNAARPYSINHNDQTVKRLPYRNLDAIGPAGSINSNLNDMLNWLHLHMADGAPLTDANGLRNLHSAYVTVPPQAETAPPIPQIHGNGYGLGWASQTYWGYQRIWHTGGIDGFITDVSFFPQARLGIIVFNNGQDSLSTTVSRSVSDILLGLERIDWRQKVEDVISAGRKKLAEAHGQFHASRKADAPLTHAIGAYVGNYGNPGYGDMTISHADDSLQATYNGLTLELTHFHYNTFATHHELLEDAPPLALTFHIGISGEIEALTVRLEPTTAPIRFTKAV